MKCEQYTCANHTVLGCDHPNCFYFTGLHNEVNAAAPPAANSVEKSFDKVLTPNQ